MSFISVPNYYFCYNFRTFQNGKMGGDFEFIVIDTPLRQTHQKNTLVK